MPQEFQQLTPSLWVAQSDVYTTNSGIFFSQGQACLIDPAVLPDEIQTIRNKLGGQNLKAENIVLTHHHWDHLFGPEHFPGVRIITQNEYGEALSGEGGNRTLTQMQRFDKEYGIVRSRVFRFPKADITFEKGMRVQVGDMHLDLIHAPGHAADQMVIFQPDDGTLWAADMLSDLEIPFVDHIKDYMATLARLIKMDIQVLVPGHGHVTDNTEEIRGRFEEDMAYLDELHQRVESALKADKNLDEIQENCAAMQFKHPEDNAGPHKWNVEVVYRELMGAETE